MCYYERQTKQINCVFLLLQIIAFAASSIAANIILIKNPNHNTLLAIEDDNFTPQRWIMFLHISRNLKLLMILI